MATSTKTSKRTWRQWMIDSGRDESVIDALAYPRWTRAGALHEAHRLGAPLTDAMLRRWEAAGALPGPERQWSQTAGAVIALYPKFMPQLIKIANDLHRGEGRPLSDIGPLVADRLEDVIRESYLTGAYEPDESQEIIPILQAYAVKIEKDIGKPVSRIRLSLEGPDGQEVWWLADGIPDRLRNQLHDS